MSEKDVNKNNNNKTKKKNITQVAEKLFGSIIADLGYELWNIEYYKEPSPEEWILEVTIDKDGGISVDDCEKVHRAIEPIIDEADPIEHSYSLQVSSPGLNRELKKDFHIDRYINHEVTVKLFSKHELMKSKTFRGVLSGFEGDEIKIKISVSADDGQKEIVFTRKEIAHIYAYDKIEF